MSGPPMRSGTPSTALLSSCIVVCGLDYRGDGHVLEDASGKYLPHEWASKAIGLYRKWSADRVVAEVNNGGEMVASTIRSLDRNMSYKSVHASKGKYARAEPVSALYEQGRIHHCGLFAELEDEMRLRAWRVRQIPRPHGLAGVGD